MSLRELIEKSLEGPQPIPAFEIGPKRVELFYEDELDSRYARKTK